MSGNALHQRLRDVLQSREASYLDLLRRMVAINSFTRNQSGVEAVADLTAEAFEGLGFGSEKIPAQDRRYGPHRVYFFYVKLEEEVVRVEVPEWVATDIELLHLTHSLVVDQCKRGHGYPVALSEAHERAVVTVRDRDNFWQLVDASLVDEHMPVRSSGKYRSKKTRWV